MKKITEQAVTAFMENRPGKFGNTVVTVDDYVVKLRLFGNVIAEKELGDIRITDAGWFSNTTRERLNGLLDAVQAGFRLSRAGGRWTYGPDNKLSWDGGWKKITVLRFYAGIVDRQAVRKAVIDDMRTSDPEDCIPNG